jgi:hypothetical protein
MRWTAPTVLGVLAILAGAARAAPRRVDDVESLRRAVASARPGTRIEIAPGTYPGGLHFTGIAGREGKPVTLAAADPEDPPVFTGGTSGMQLTDPVWVVLEHLVFAGARGNGLNIDDGGTYETPARHVVLRDLTVRDVGPSGNRDGIKLSGVRDFLVTGCTIERWGDRGSGIDMVGCHDGRILRCTFRNGDERGTNGVQAKGGTTDVAVECCRFEHAGMRAIQLGGSTGREYFRPALETSGNAEARRIKVMGCEIIGSQAALAFVSSEDSLVMHVTIYRPTRWVLRILQEAAGDEFLPCRKGTFAHSIVVWRESELRRHVNIGPGTEPESFAFENVWWFCEDAPRKSRPELPGPQKGGSSGKDPMLRDPAGGDLRRRPGSPARTVGADAWEPREERGR